MLYIFFFIFNEWKEKEAKIIIIITTSELQIATAVVIRKANRHHHNREMNVTSYGGLYEYLDMDKIIYNVGTRR